MKFQLFRAEDVVTDASPKARYQLETTDRNESQFAMLKSLEIPMETYPELMREANSLGIEFLCTCYSAAEIDFLDEIGVPAFKFASALIIELPLVRHAAEKGKPVLLSTGMSTMTEIREAVQVAKVSGADIGLLQCTTDYPASPADANLRVIDTLTEEFAVPVGYSDHTLGDATALAAVACGATFIEKHLTLDTTMSGPDHAASLDPSGFAEMVRRIREVESALGTGRKEPNASRARERLGHASKPRRRHCDSRGNCDHARSGHDEETGVRPSALRTRLRRRRTRPRRHPPKRTPDPRTPGRH